MIIHETYRQIKSDYFQIFWKMPYFERQLITLVTSCRKIEQTQMAVGKKKMDKCLLSVAFPCPEMDPALIAPLDDSSD